MDNKSPLPEAPSSNLYLTHPTSSEFDSIYSLSFQAWGDALTLPQYLEESAFLTTVPLAKDGGMTVWFLTEKTASPNNRLILCSCETFRNRAFVTDRKGHFSETIIHSVASVFCDPRYRGRGYAARLMQELTKILPNWQTEAYPCIGSVLYSDVGKTYYAKHGWHPFPLNDHIELDPVQIPELQHTDIKFIVEGDLDYLCKEDEAMIRKLMTSSCSKKIRLMLVPDLDHMLWHHRKAEFACDKIFGKQPPYRGAMTGEPKDRVWVIWTHRYYGHPQADSDDNTLYILRVVIENRSVNPEREEHLAEQMQAILQAAQNEAAEWNLRCVKLWDPGHLLQSTVERTGIPHRIVKREEESIASLRWFGEGSGKDDMVEWLGNEKYGWC